MAYNSLSFVCLTQVNNWFMYSESLMKKDLNFMKAACKMSFSIIED